MFIYLFAGVKHYFQQYFSYIVAVSFIGGGNQISMEKTDNLYHIMLYQVILARAGFEFTMLLVINISHKTILLIEFVCSNCTRLSVSKVKQC
jgi:hypothetical protein